MVDSDTTIELYAQGILIGRCKVYDFPHKHDMNEYYGHLVEIVMPTSENSIEVHVKDLKTRYVSR